MAFRRISDLSSSLQPSGDGLLPISEGDKTYKVSLDTIKSQIESNLVGSFADSSSLDTLSTQVQSNVDSINSLNQFTSSADDRLVSLETFTGSLDDNFATDLEVTQLRNYFNSYTSSANNILQDHEVQRYLHGERLTSIETFTGSLSNTVNDIINIEGRLDSIEVESGSIRSDFNSFTSSFLLISESFDQRISALENPSSTPSPTATPIPPTSTPVPTATVEPTPTPEPLQPTPTSTVEPTATVEPTPTSTVEPTPTPEPLQPTPTATVEPTSTPVPSPTPTVEPTPTPEPLQPTPTSTIQPTPTPTVDFTILDYMMVWRRNTVSNGMAYDFTRLDENNNYFYSNEQIKCIYETFGTGGGNFWNIAVGDNSEGLMSVGDNSWNRVTLGNPTNIVGTFNSTTRTVWNDLTDRLGNGVQHYIVTFVSGEVTEIISFDSIGDVTGCVPYVDPTPTPTSTVGPTSTPTPTPTSTPEPPVLESIGRIGILQVEAGSIWDNNNAQYSFVVDNNAITNLEDITCYFTQLILDNPNQYYAFGNNSYKISGSTMQVGSQMYKSNGDTEDYVYKSIIHDGNSYNDNFIHGNTITYYETDGNGVITHITNHTICSQSTPTPTATDVLEPTPTPTVEPTSTPVPSPTPTATDQPENTPTPTPNEGPQPTPTPQVPTATPVGPTSTPVPSPTPTSTTNIQDISLTISINNDGGVNPWSGGATYNDVQNHLCTYGATNTNGTTRQTDGDPDNPQTGDRFYSGGHPLEPFGRKFLKYYPDMTDVANWKWIDVDNSGYITVSGFTCNNPTPTVEPTSTPVPNPTPTPTQVPNPTATVEPTSTPVPSPTPNPPTYSLSSTNISPEGGNLTFTLTTTGLQDGDIVPFTLSGTATIGDDYSDVNPKEFEITNNSSTYTVTTFQDNTTDGVDETIILTLDMVDSQGNNTGGITTTASIGDTSLTPTQTPQPTSTQGPTPTSTVEPTPTPVPSTPTPTPTVSLTCLDGDNDNTVNYSEVQFGAGNYYIFNGNYDTYHTNTGTYLLKNVSSSHPITVLNNGKESLIYVDGTHAGTKIGSDGNSYSYYYGDVIITVQGNYGTVSYECYYHGYMGGQDNLVFSNTCPVSPIPTPTSTVEPTATPVPPTSTPAPTPTATSDPSIQVLRAISAIDQVTGNNTSLTGSDFYGLSAQEFYCEMQSYEQPGTWSTFYSGDGTWELNTQLYNYQNGGMGSASTFTGTYMFRTNYNNGALEYWVVTVTNGVVSFIQQVYYDGSGDLISTGIGQLTACPTPTPTPTPSATETINPTPTPTIPPSQTPQPTPTSTPSPTTTVEPTSTPVPSPTPTVEPTSTPVASPTPTEQPEATPTPTPNQEPTPTPQTPTATPVGPTPTPTVDAANTIFVYYP